MASEPRNYPDYVFVAYDEDFSAQTYDIAVSLEPGNLVGRPVKYIRHDLNTRPAPAATDTGLETVAFQHRRIDKYGVVGDWRPYKRDLFGSDRIESRELVTRSQAEELLAAERAKTERLADDYQAIREQLHRGWRECKDLKADNAAKDARIKELEAELEHAVSDEDTGAWRYWCKKAKELSRKCSNQSSQLAGLSKKASALEAKLAAAENGVRYALANLRMNKSDEAFLADVLGGKTS